MSKVSSAILRRAQESTVAKVIAKLPGRTVAVGSTGGTLTAEIKAVLYKRNVGGTTTAASIAVESAGLSARSIAEFDLTAGTIRARPIAAGLARGTGTDIVAGGCRWTGTLLTIGAVSTTALAVRVAAQSIAVALGLGKGSADAAQTEQTSNGRSSNGFEGLAA